MRGPEPPHPGESTRMLPTKRRRPATRGESRGRQYRGTTWLPARSSDTILCWGNQTLLSKTHANHKKPQNKALGESRQPPAGGPCTVMAPLPRFGCAMASEHRLCQRGVGGPRAQNGITHRQGIHTTANDNNRRAVSRPGDYACVEPAAMHLLVAARAIMDNREGP